VIRPAGQVFVRCGRNEPALNTSDSSSKSAAIGELSDNTLGVVFPDVVLQAAEPCPAQVEALADSSTSLSRPASEGSELGDNTFAFSTCCQNRSELIGGCLRINSIKALRSISIAFTFHRRKCPGKSNRQQINRKESWGRNAALPQEGGQALPCAWREGWSEAALRSGELLVTGEKSRAETLRPDIAYQATGAQPSGVSATRAVASVSGGAFSRMKDQETSARAPDS